MVEHSFIQPTNTLFHHSLKRNCFSGLFELQEITELSIQITKITSTFITFLIWYLLNGSCYFSYLYVTQFFTLEWLTVLANKPPKSTLNHNHHQLILNQISIYCSLPWGSAEKHNLTSLLKDIKGKPILIWGVQDRSIQWAVSVR